MEMTGAEICIRSLEQQGIRIVAGIPGGANLPLYTAMSNSSIRHVLARHEQGAGFMAQGMARAAGRTAVCLGTSGPGATNLMTAIADAYMDSIPIVAITGQVPASLIGTMAFQEVDTCAMARPVTKAAFFVRSADELFDVVPRAFAVASGGRPGPVLIDIPKDVQLQRVPWREPAKYSISGVPHQRDPDKIRGIAGMINRSRRPVIYMGGGIIHSGAHRSLLRLAEKSCIPAASTLMGLGAFPSDHPLSLGMLGMHGEKSTNLALGRADLLLAFGVRFDDRATGKVAEFCPDAQIVHIDIDPAEIGKIKQPVISLVSDIGPALEQIIPYMEDRQRPEWLAEIARLKKDAPPTSAQDFSVDHPVSVIRQIAEVIPAETIITTDVGQHQMWAAQGYPFRQPRTFLTSGGLGTMGFGLPVAIGAALAEPERRVVCFTGDGSLLMNIQELAVLAEEDLDVSVIILNNDSLGLVRQQQEFFYGKNYFASLFQCRPDFAAIGRAFGIWSLDVGKGELKDRKSLLQRALTGRGPCLINIPVRMEENVYPMVAPKK